jgi:hypothetical protein
MAGLAAVGLWSLANGWTREGVNWWAVAATMAIAPAFGVGFYLGKVEARGALAGFDRALDRMAGVIGQVATMRDRPAAAAQRGTATRWDVTLPEVLEGEPRISHRQLTGGDGMIDL